MVYLNPPFPMINGVSLLPDHEDRTFLLPADVAALHPL